MSTQAARIVAARRELKEVAELLFLLREVGTGPSHPIRSIDLDLITAAWTELHALGERYMAALAAAHETPAKAPGRLEDTSKPATPADPAHAEPLSLDSPLRVLLTRPRDAFDVLDAALSDADFIAFIGHLWASPLGHSEPDQELRN